MLSHGDHNESPLPVRPIHTVSITISVCLRDDASTEDSLSFTRPVFPLPGQAVVIQPALGFPPSFAPDYPGDSPGTWKVGTGASTLLEL